jgi:hypothetical protein
MDDKRPEVRFTRRDLLSGTFRWGTLGLIGVAGAWVAAKRRRLVRQGLCENDSACAGCPALAQCGLPAASNWREAKR